MLFHRGERLNLTIIPLALVGYEMIDSQRGPLKGETKMILTRKTINVRALMS